MDREESVITPIEREFRTWLEERGLFYLGARRSDISDSTLVFIMEERTLMGFFVIFEHVMSARCTKYAQLGYLKGLVIGAYGGAA